MGKITIQVLRGSYLGTLLLGLLLLLLGDLLQPLATQAAASAQATGVKHVDVAPFKLPITPVSAQYYDRLIKDAEGNGASALLIELDTPGGLVDSMQDMVQRTLASTVPIIVYVSPQGARAASAGVFIVLASHVAAMAPNTRIGSSEVILNEGSGGSDSAT